MDAARGGWLRDGTGAQTRHRPDQQEVQGDATRSHGVDCSGGQACAVLSSDRLRRRADCRGNLVQDAYLAALAIEHQCVFVTTDRDFARFPRLQWQHPLDDDRRTVNPD